MYAADPRSFGGRYVATDLFKETFAAYAASRESRNRYNAPVHNSAAVLSAEQFRRVLRQADDPARDTVVLLTGIPGAGKTSLVLAGGGLSPDTKAVFEGQLVKPETTIPKVQQVLDAGLRPVIIAVHATPESALRNTLKRFGEEGRAPASRPWPTSRAAWSRACGPSMGTLAMRPSFVCTTTGTKTTHGNSKGGKKPMY